MCVCVYKFCLFLFWCVSSLCAELPCTVLENLCAKLGIFLPLPLCKVMHMCLCGRVATVFVLAYSSTCICILPCASAEFVFLASFVCESKRERDEFLSMCRNSMCVTPSTITQEYMAVDGRGSHRKWGLDSNDVNTE